MRRQFLLLAAFAAFPGNCRELGVAARGYIEARVPSWGEVVAEDLLRIITRP